MGGISVYALEIERVLAAHPAVAEAAVVGIPGDRDEMVTAFVTLRWTAAVREILAHCRRSLAPYKLPRQIYVVDALPRNANGKVLKAGLVAAVTADL